ATFDAIGDSVILLDSQRRIVRANAAAATCVGRQMHEIVGRPCYRFFHESDSPVDACPFAKTIESRTAENVEMTEGHGACRLYSIYPAAPGGDRSVAAICVARDVTERKQADENLRQTLAELSLLRDQLQQQNVYLREEVKSLSNHTRVIGTSEALQRI